MRYYLFRIPEVNPVAVGAMLLFAQFHYTAWAVV